MIVVADTTPLHYLILIGEVWLLEKLFGHILIPPAVRSELQRARTPQSVKEWIESQPTWLEIKLPTIALPDVAKSLGRGEREALALAVELPADALLLDDKRAKNEARRRNIPVITILNILEAAAAKSLINLPDAVERLRQTNFYLPAPGIVEAMLERDQIRTDAS